MNEPEKKPAKVEPAIGNIDDIKPTPAAANSNDSKVEPVVGAMPAIDLTGAKKDPVVVVPVAAVKDVKPEPVVPAANNNDAPAAPVAPVVPAAVAAPATNEAPPASPPAPVVAAADAAAAPEKKSRMKGFLKGAFNFAVSAGVGFAVNTAIKATIGAALATTGAPMLLTLVATSLAIGVGGALIADLKNRHGQKKEGKELSKYFSRAHGKELLSKRSLTTFGISTAGALLGGALALGFHEGVIQNAWHHFWGGTPAPAVLPVVVPVETAVLPPVETAVLPPVETAVLPPVETAVLPPVETVVAAPICLSPADQFSGLIDGHHVSARVTEAMTRAASTNAAVAAQGTKDLAFFAFNGFDGVPKDPHVAVELFKQAADAGNLQAKVDLVYMQYHGLGGVAADKAAAAATMHNLPGARAANFVHAWGGTTAKAAFSTDSILKGMTVGCPAPI